MGASGASLALARLHPPLRRSKKAPKINPSASIGDMDKFAKALAAENPLATFGGMPARERGPGGTWQRTRGAVKRAASLAQ